jgi:hypothetical protein
MGDSLEDNVMDPRPRAEFSFYWCIAILVDNQYVRLDFLEDILKVHHSPPIAHSAILNAAKCLDHILPFVLCADGISSLQETHVFIGAKTDIEVAVRCGLF